jgi:transforming growth factor-beta-induced protein
MKKIIRSLLVVSLLTVGLASCKEDKSKKVEETAKKETAKKENVAPADVTAIAISSPDHKILVEALTAADLVGTLQGEGPFTVFAPTDAAFTAALAKLGVTKDELFANKELLTSILLHHVVSGNVLSTDLTNGEVATLNPDGADVTVDLTNGAMIDNAKVTAADLKAGNGVVHVIDAVLVPSFDDVTEIAINSENHTILVEALTAAGLVSTLQGEGPFTVFAPTNDAFVAALATLGLTKDQLFADKDLLTKVLLHHVVSGNVLSTDLTNGEVTTLSEQSIKVDLTSGVMINNANVTAADLKAGNGVVHVVDAVLVPSM